jgi:alpha-L-rhamnosidase
LYPVKMGATTIWERWDGQKTDSTFEDAGMNSFNHYAYGAIGDWMYRVSAGIETKGPGYKKFIIQPHPTKKLSFSKATFESSYGTIASGWERIGSDILISVKIPANTEATVILPVYTPQFGPSEGGVPVFENRQFSNVRKVENSIMFEAGSGDYIFKVVEK